MSWISDWPAVAGCRGIDPDRLFVQGAAQNRAKLICSGCEVRTECLADALDNEIEFGVWGGMTERERRALLRRRSDVRSWRELLESARNRHEVVSIPAPSISLRETMPAVREGAGRSRYSTTQPSKIPA